MIIDKMMWPRGEWDAEPDKKQWQDPETDLVCLAVRDPVAGHWYGYVGVPSGHPLHGVKHNQASELLVVALEQRKKRPIGKQPSFALMIACVLGGELVKASPEIVFEVHGGITFSNGCMPGSTPTDGEPWWFGFDCAHCDDLSPGLSHTKDGCYRSLKYVEGECIRLAKQLAAIR